MMAAKIADAPRERPGGAVAGYLIDTWHFATYYIPTPRCTYIVATIPLTWHPINADAQRAARANARPTEIPRRRV
jgi:hypothetical protein